MHRVGLNPNRETVPRMDQLPSELIDMDETKQNLRRVWLASQSFVKNYYAINIFKVLSHEIFNLIKIYF
jgi:hypothetical protein